ncbi:head-tail connector protein [Roseibium sp.]|uniref:head-tail connector protein n=1 Tax=Roseibium sp. TaxID=1936156 RepID=UPI003D11460D
MLRPKRILAPTETPVTVEDAKCHLRVSSSEDDALIAGLIDTAVDSFDGRAGILGRCLVWQTWKAWFHGFPCGRSVRLPFPDVDAASVVVRYLDTTASEQTFPATGFNVFEDTGGAYLLRHPEGLWPATCDRPDAVSVEFRAGFGSAAEVPGALKSAILLLVGHLYENREAVTQGARAGEMPLGAMHLAGPYRVRKL